MTVLADVSLENPSVPGLRAKLGKIWPVLENTVITTLLAVMVILPIVELLLRALFRTGIQASAALEQHLALVVAMLGSAIAARENKLLSISILTTLLHGRLLNIVVSIAGSIGAAVCLLLAWASFQFVIAERGAMTMLNEYIPVWVVQSMMPIGFIFVAWRLLRNTVAKNTIRVIALLLSVLFVALVATETNGPESLVHGALFALGFAAIFGAPLFTVLGGIALILFWAQGVPVAALAIDQYRMVVNPTLPAIPLFTLAGFLLAESRAPDRLLRVFNALFGRSRSGAAAVTVLASCLFTSFTGASGVTILALGGLLLPMLIRWNYPERAAVGVTTAAGLPGVLLAPSLPLILFAIVANVDIREMFLGALPPALLMIGLVFAWSRWQGSATPPPSRVVDRREIRSALAEAKWELALPFIVFVSLFSGFATAVEAAAITAAYAFIVVVCIHRDLASIRKIVDVVAECGLLVGGILLILGVALGLTNYFVDAQIPDRLSTWIQVTVDNRWVFLAVLNLFLLIAGCLMDVYSAIIVLTPLIIPIARTFGIDPVHLGVLFLANLELGYLTPPVGVNLFYAASRFNRPLLYVCRSVVSLFPALVIGVLLITYVPELSRLLR